MCDPWQSKAFVKGIFGGAARNTIDKQKYDSL